MPYGCCPRALAFVLPLRGGFRAACVRLFGASLVARNGVQERKRVVPAKTPAVMLAHVDNLVHGEREKLVSAPPGSSHAEETDGRLEDQGDSRWRLLATPGSC